MSICQAIAFSQRLAQIERAVFFLCFSKHSLKMKDLKTMSPPGIQGVEAKGRTGKLGHHVNSLQNVT